MAGQLEPFGLQRFVDAQDRVYDTVVAELRGGRKRSHWIWFIFPQLAGLGSSAMAQRYGIASLAEARAYLAHDLLGPRLHECARLITAVSGRSIEEVLGRSDELKLRSSMTLFARACAGHAGADCPGCSDFRAVLDRYFAGEEDPVTVDRLAAEPA
ncbi:DUF1810 domain-containing protein [[Mycobacterium] nativiensis]|uniref:DUF1810 domain-containing protein n=1 Tax=[Mycobacterium] nativiensis TaxID=2855503 RepID=A0ABU5XRG2_9MYCO|nr:DUF1810 domain-containing protein [Mycolicibacter sp. MYC340]MEB3030559.1 DUF1810 domain-containing protein [Mycolicibacter sp. MYC340]